MNPSLTPEFITEFAKRFEETDDMGVRNWVRLSKNASLTLETIQEFNNTPYSCWNWDLLSSNLGLTPEIIRTFATSSNGKWNWVLLSQNPALTPETIREFQDKIHIKLIDKSLLNSAAEELNLDPVTLDPYIYYINHPDSLSYFLKNLVNRNKKKYYSTVILAYLDKYTIPDLARISVNFL